ncbi:hypothetical protein SEVCU128_0945 [Staphylococcus epidermidis VCU128]|nr:hypothetical protein SEVCU128_0945 [Staphylococcus epidermidis VCU128]
MNEKSILIYIIHSKNESILCVYTYYNKIGSVAKLKNM